MDSGVSLCSTFHCPFTPFGKTLRNIILELSALQLDNHFKNAVLASPAVAKIEPNTHISDVVIGNFRKQTSVFDVCVGLCMLAASTDSRELNTWPSRCYNEAHSDVQFGLHSLCMAPV